MQEVLKYLRANGFKTYIVSGGGQDFVPRLRRTDLWHPARAGRRHRGRHEVWLRQGGKPFLTKEPKLLLNDNNAGKPEGIHLMIGRRPSRRSATHPATSRCWSAPKPATARGSACWCCTTMRRANTPTARRKACPKKIGTFPQALYDKAKKDGWTVISMKDDWNRIFAFENK